MLRLLLPGTADIGDLAGARSDALQALADLYAYPDPVPETGWVRASMVSSLDGSTAGADGRSGSVSSAVDRTLLGVLRALSDVVLVGAGTVRAEREHYRPPKESSEFADRRRAAGQSPAPALAVVTSTGDLPKDIGLFDGDRPAYLVVPASADLGYLRSFVAPERLLVAGEDRVDASLAVTRLAALGLRRVLLEGGPTLLGAAVGAGRVDEFCLSLSPLVAGGSSSRLTQGPDVGTSVRLAHLVEADGTLLSRWLAHQDRHLPGRPLR